MHNHYLTHQEVRDFCLVLNIQPLDEPGELYVPTEDPSYLFRKDMLMELLMFWGTGQTSMKLLGYIGTGKTSLIMQFHAAMRYPCLKVVMTKRTEAADLIAKLSPTLNGQGFEVKHGPLAIAALSGVSILIDEYNLGRDDVLCACNGFLEGSAQYVEELDKVVTPIQGFRCFAAENPDDQSLGYQARNAQDPSNDDRFAVNVWVDYPTPAQETPIIKSLLGHVLADEEISNQFAEKFIAVANLIRSQYMGVSDDGSAMEVTMSTRGLIAWAQNYCIALQFGFADAASRSIQRALLDRLNRQSPSREAILELVRTQFGEVVTPAVAV